MPSMSDDGLEPTVAMPKIEPPPSRPRTEHGVVEPPTPVRVSPAATSPSTARETPPPTIAVIQERPRFAFGHPVGYTFARLTAFVIDFVLVTVVVTSLGYALFAINPFTGLPTNSEAGFDTTLALGAGIAAVYLWIAEAVFGTTIGKLAVGLHVYAVRGGFVGLGRSLLRNLLRPIDLLVIGGILALLPGHRRLGDLLGGTVVARSPLRAFAPLVGWVLIIVLAGAPFVFVPIDRLLAGLVAFGEFIPALAVRLGGTMLSLLGGAAPH